MDEPRRALVPVTVENSAGDDLFAGVRSPVLIRINSSCDSTVSCYVSLNFFSMIRTCFVLARTAARNVTHHMLMEAKEMCDILK